MRKKFATILLLAPLLAMAVGLPPVPAPQSSLDISVRAGPAAGTFQVHATVSDRRTGKVAAVPDLLIRAGTWGKTNIANPNAPALGTLSVTVNPSGTHAAYFAEFRRNGKNVDSQSGTLRVSR